MFTTVCDFNSKLFRIEITESINIAQNLITNFYLVAFQKIVLPYTAVDCNLVFPAFILRLPSFKMRWVTFDCLVQSSCLYSI